MIGSAEALDFKVIMLEKAYPEYCGSCDRFAEIREDVDRHENLLRIGKNGRIATTIDGRSALAAMMSVDKPIFGSLSKDPLQDVNTDMDDNEERPKC